MMAKATRRSFGISNVPDLDGWEEDSARHILVRVRDGMADFFNVFVADCLGHMLADGE